MPPPLVSWCFPSQLHHMILADFSHCLKETIGLLSYQGFGGSEEENLAVFEPSVEIEHHSRVDVGLAQTGWQRDEGIFIKSGPHNLELVCPKGF